MSSCNHVHEKNGSFKAGFHFAPETLSLPALREASVGMLARYAPALFKVNEQGSSRQTNRSVPSRGSELTGKGYESLKDLVHTISEGYNNNLVYHSFAHAVDVTQAMFVFVSEFICDLPDVEKFYLLLTCLCHDLGHFGVGNGILNNDFAQCSFTRQHKRCLKDEGCKASTMEFYHLENAIQIIEGHEFFTMDGMMPNIVKNLRVWMGDLIMATDLANQKFFLDVVNGTRHFQPLENSDVEVKRPESIFLLLVKLADLANVFRPFRSAKNWTKLVMIEADCVLTLKQFLLDSNKPMNEINESLMLDLCVSPPVSIKHKLDCDIVEKRMQGFIEMFVVPILLVLRDFHFELFEHLCRSMKSSLGSSSYTDTTFVDDICPTLRANKENVPSPTNTRCI